MGEILAVGVTHYPPLAGRDDMMTGILKRMLQNPALPPELLKRENWPAPMREEWGADEGVTAARRHREALVPWFRKVRAAIDDFKPDLILMWGDDQYENFKEDIIPPYCICAYDSMEFGPPPKNAWDEPAGKKFKWPGHPVAAKFLATRLLEAGFDTAYAYRPLHDTLGHAFGNGLLYLDYDRKGFSYPVVPFAINCYGRRVIAQRGGLPMFENPPSEAQLDPPSPTPQRLFDLGAATAKALSASPWRVVLMASSSWSHAFLTAKHYFLHPDIPADLMLYEALRKGDYETWRNRSLAAFEDSGQQEVLNWVCLAGALSQLGRKAKEIDFITSWTLNSSKCFLVA
jgi:Catalytic LigB subunit of aromatic ring-opening dioxygenase